MFIVWCVDFGLLWMVKCLGLVMICGCVVFGFCMLCMKVLVSVVVRKGFLL